MSDYLNMVLKNLQKEMDQQEYTNRLRRRNNQCTDHVAILSTCHGCRAAFWIKKLQELDVKKEEPSQPAIGLTNTVKTEAAEPEIKTEVQTEE